LGNVFFFEVWMWRLVSLEVWSMACDIIVTHGLYTAALPWHYGDSSP